MTKWQNVFDYEHVIDYIIIDSNTHISRLLSPLLVLKKQEVMLRAHVAELRATLASINKKWNPSVPQNQKEWNATNNHVSLEVDSSLV